MKQTIKVDFSSLSDIDKAINLLKYKRNKLRKILPTADFGMSQKAIDITLPAIENCYNQIHQDSGNYYVYAHCDPTIELRACQSVKDLWLTSFGLTHKPVYIGKGTGNRFKDLNRNDSHRKIRSQLKSKELDLIPVKLITDVSETTALELEGLFIDVLGIMALNNRFGYLVNLDEGLNVVDRRQHYCKIMRKVVRNNGFSVV